MSEKSGLSNKSKKKKEGLLKSDNLVDLIIESTTIIKFKWKFPSLNRIYLGLKKSKI